MSLDHCVDDASYVLGALSPVERQAFEQHLSSCPNCQKSVAKLAGLPGLLSLVSIAEFEQEPAPVPDTLLPRLLTAAARERRRHRWVWTGTVAAAAACVIALVITLAIRPSVNSAVSLPTPVVMQAVVPGPMSVSLQLVDKQWGTSIVITCHYAGTHDSGDDYQLVVFDGANNPQPAGWWMSVAGGGSTVTTASSLRLKDISRVEVQLPDGRRLLTAVPPRT